MVTSYVTPFVASFATPTCFSPTCTVAITELVAMSIIEILLSCWFLYTYISSRLEKLGSLRILYII
jgi:hypothetical protein